MMGDQLPLEGGSSRPVFVVDFTLGFELPYSSLILTSNLDHFLAFDAVLLAVAPGRLMWAFQTDSLPRSQPRRLSHS